MRPLHKRTRGERGHGINKVRGSVQSLCTKLAQRMGQGERRAHGMGGRQVAMALGREMGARAETGTRGDRRTEHMGWGDKLRGPQKAARRLYTQAAMGGRGSRAEVAPACHGVCRCRSGGG